MSEVLAIGLAASIGPMMIGTAALITNIQSSKRLAAHMDAEDAATERLQECLVANEKAHEALWDAVNGMHRRFRDERGN